MFSYTGLTKPQVDNMINKWAVYMTGDGRISMAGLSGAARQRALPRLCATLPLAALSGRILRLPVRSRQVRLPGGGHQGFGGELLRLTGAGLAETHQPLLPSTRARETHG